jgi:hypothetical protein
VCEGDEEVAQRASNHLDVLFPHPKAGAEGPPLRADVRAVTPEPHYHNMRTQPLKLPFHVAGGGGDDAGMLLAVSRVAGLSHGRGSEHERWKVDVIEAGSLALGGWRCLTTPSGALPGTVSVAQAIYAPHRVSAINGEVASAQEAGAFTLQTYQQTARSRGRVRHPCHAVWFRTGSALTPTLNRCPPARSIVFNAVAAMGCRIGGDIKATGFAGGFEGGEVSDVWRATRNQCKAYTLGGGKDLGQAGRHGRARWRRSGGRGMGGRASGARGVRWVGSAEDDGTAADRADATAGGARSPWGREWVGREAISLLLLFLLPVYGNI